MEEVHAHSRADRSAILNMFNIADRSGPPTGRSGVRLHWPIVGPVGPTIGQCKPPIRLIGKLVVASLFVLTERFTLGVMAKVLEIAVFERGESVSAKF